MKLSIISSAIAVALAVLFALLAAHWCRASDQATAIGITTALTLALAFIGMCVRLENSLVQTNLRVLSAVFAVIFMLIAIVMCFVSATDLTTYYLIEGIIALVFIAICHNILKVKNV